MPSGRDASYAAIYYPNLVVNDGKGDFEVGPSGAVAGVWAATDAARGVWKAPAGTQASVLGTKGFSGLRGSPSEFAKASSASCSISAPPSATTG